MKVYVYTFLLMAALVAFAFKVNDNIDKITPSKKIVTKSLTVNTFNELEISNAIDVKYIQTPGKPRVTVQAPDNIIERVIVKTEGDKLVVRLRENTSISNWRDNVVKVTVSAPAPEEIEMSGATSFTAASLNVKSLEVDVCGASSFKIGNLRASKCEFDVSGASDVKLDAASVDDCDYDISGASSVKVRDFNGTKTSVDISGASSLTVTGTTSMLDLEVSGTSKASLANFVSTKGKVDVSGMSTAKTHIKTLIGRSVTGMSTLDNIYK